MSSNTVAKKSSGDVARRGESAEYEHHEQSSKVTASAGLNLNILGALGGVFSSKSSKENSEGGSVAEKKEEHSAVKGAAAGNLGANAAASAEQKAKSTRAQIQDK